MTSKEEIFDSPRGFVRAHIQEFVESNGRKGQMWLGAPALLLITRGRKSGKLRRTGLIYGRDGKDYLLVASAGGAPKHPLWYLNLVANPEVELQVGPDQGHSGVNNQRMMEFFIENLVMRPERLMAPQK